jgi:hypothetical protein
MSVCNYLVCHTCKVYLWIGQSGRIYTSAHAMTQLQKFLFDHMTDHLEFTVDPHDDASEIPRTQAPVEPSTL